MSNLTTKMTLTPIEINGKLHFPQIWYGETLHIVSNMKIHIFQMKIFPKITLFLFIICSFVKLNVLVSLPKSFHGPLDNDNALPLVHCPFY